MHTHHYPQKSVDSFKFFTYESERDVIESCPAIFLGDADTEQIELTHFLQHVRLKMLLLVPLFDVWRNFLLRKLTHCLHQCFMIFGQFKFNHWNCSLSE